jgi:non-canonical (house-cleaning) NTP pyrophosphatase
MFSRPSGLILGAHFNRCHNALHAQDHNVTIEATITADGQVFTYDLECQVLIDHKHQTMMFFTDQLDDIFLYWVKQGEDEWKLFSGKKFRDNDTLMKLVHKTKEAFQNKLVNFSQLA